MSKARRAKKRKSRSLKRGLLYIAGLAFVGGVAGGVAQQLAKGRP